MQTNIGIGLATKASDLAQAQEGFQRLGLSADEAGRRVQAIAESAKTTGGKIESALVSAVASVNRFATAAEAGSSRAGRAGEQAALQVERLQQAIEDARATGAPVSDEAIATLKQLDTQLDKNVQRVGEMKRVQEDTKRAIDDATRAQGGLGQGITTTSDLLGVFNNRWEQMALRIGVGIGAVHVAAGALREFSSGVAEVASSLGANDEAVSRFKRDMDQVVAIMENPLRIFGLIVSKSREAIAAMAETAVGSGAEVSAELAARNAAGAQSGIEMLERRRAMMRDVLGDSEALADASRDLLSVWASLGDSGRNNSAAMAAIFQKALEIEAGLQRTGQTGAKAWRDLAAAASAYSEQQKAQAKAERDAEQERTRASEEARRAQQQLAEHWRQVAAESASILTKQREDLERVAAKWRDYFASIAPGRQVMRGFQADLEDAARALKAVEAGLLSPDTFSADLAAKSSAYSAAMQRAAEEVLKQFKGLDPTAGQAPASSTAQAEQILKRLREANAEREKFERMGGLGRALQEGLYGANDQLSLAVAGIGRMIEGLAQAKVAADAIGKSEGWAMMAQGLYAVAQASGVLSHNMTSGGFGARGEGNYAAEGSGVGAVVGAIIGAYFGNPQAGMAIGSAAGGILGSFIQKGAEEALATSVDGVNGIALLVNKSEGGLGRVIEEIGYSINEALLAVMDVLGGSIEDLPEVSAKVRDGIITIIVGGVKGKFKEMDDAIGFAVTELLKQGDIAGMSDTIRQVLSRTRAPDISALTRDLEFGQWYERLGLAEAGVAFLDAIGSFRTKLRKATEFGLDLEPIYQDLERNLGDIRNQILGISESDEDRIRRQAAAYNAQATLFMAEEQQKKADLEMQRATLQAKADLLRAQAGIAEGELMVGGRVLEVKKLFVDQQVDIAEAELQVLAATAAGAQDILGQIAWALFQVGQLTQSIDAIDEILAGIQIISPEEIDAAIGRLGSSGSGSVSASGPSPADQLADFNKQLADLRRESMPDLLRRLADLRDKFADLRATAVELGQSTEELDRIEQQRLDALDEEIQAQIRSKTRGSGESAGWQDQLDELSRWLAQTVDYLSARGEDTDAAIAAYQAAVAELRDSILSSLSPTFALQKRFSDLAKTLDWLAANAEALGVSEEELGRIRSEMGSTMYLDLAERIARSIGDEHALAALQTLRWQMELVQYQLEVERLKALGLLTEEQVSMLEGLLADAMAFDPVAGGAGEDASAYWAAVAQQQQAAADALLEAARRMREAIERLIEFQQSLFLSDLSPLTPQQRLDEATQQAQSLVAQIMALGATDPARAGLMNQLPDILRAYLTELGDVWGTSSAQYAAGFAWVNQILNQLTGGNVIPFPGGYGGSTTPPSGPPIGTGTIGRNPTGALYTFPTASRGGAADVEQRLQRSNDLLDRAVRVLESIDRKTSDAATSARRVAAGAAR